VQDTTNLYIGLEFIRGGEMFTHLRKAGRFRCTLRFFSCKMLSVIIIIIIIIVVVIAVVVVICLLLKEQTRTIDRVVWEATEREGVECCDSCFSAMHMVQLYVWLSY